MSDYKLIPVGKSGLSCKVSPEDYEALSAFPWHTGGQLNYAVRKQRKSEMDGKSRKTIFMHKVIAGALEGEEVDHINGDPLDNRRVNLRRCSHAENIHNNRALKSTSSRFKGVSWSTRRRRWTVCLTVGEKNVWGGAFLDEVDAARRYDELAERFFGSFARKNFPN